MKTGNEANTRGEELDTGTGAQRRQLTVMFVDLVGSTPLSQVLDPEDLLEVISRYRDVCVPVIERYGGYVSRYMADGILVIFGYPTAHEDDAERAALAALGVVKGMDALNQSLAWLQVGEFRVRLGIATGLVIAGQRIGDGASKEEAIVGEPPNLVARLRGSSAGPGPAQLGSDLGDHAPPAGGAARSYAMSLMTVCCRANVSNCTARSSRCSRGRFPRSSRLSPNCLRTIAPRAGHIFRP